MTAKINKPMFYRLDEDHSVIGITPAEWREQITRPDDLQSRVLGKIAVNGELVSTMFMAIDLCAHIDEPVVFETMVFGDTGLRGPWRYTTYDAAIAGHKRVVEALRAGETP